MAALFAVHPIQVGEREDEYIVVVLNAKLCHYKICIGAQEKGIQFPNRFADNKEDVLVAFTIVEVIRDQKNKERAEAAI